MEPYADVQQSTKFPNQYAEVSIANNLVILTIIHLYLINSRCAFMATIQLY